jgi:hypothetical protein
MALGLIVSIISSQAFAAQVTLAWDPNTESDLAGYRIHYGTVNGSYATHIDVHKVTSYTVTGLSEGQTYHFAATAYDSAGNESAYSSPVSYSVPGAAPGAANGAPLRPSTPSGPSNAWVNVSTVFSTAASDPNGDSLQYRYDWGDGVLSAWGTASQSHIWAAAGQYAVRARARDSQGAESSWSRARSVSVQTAAVGGVQLPDTDGDGVPDSQDAFPNDPKEWADSNGNGMGDSAEAGADQGQAAPDVPLLISPAKDSVVSVTAVLQTGPFGSPEAGSTHAQTRWQVFRDEDDVCVLDLQSATDLTSLTVPKLVLDEETPFYWRAQFIGSNGAVSAWSGYEHFSTETTDADRNANGVPDDQEVSSTADLDKDGVPDSQQAAIKSVKMEGTTVQTGISIKDSPTSLAIESVESEDPRQPDLYANGKPKNMPFGILNVKIAVTKPGDPAVVKIHFLEPAPANGKWYEYDPAAARWIDFSAYTEFAADRMSATLTLRDGGPGDADGVANGVIIDPGGIGVGDDGSAGGGASQGGGGSGGGCFIGSVDDVGICELMFSALSLLGLSLLRINRIRGRIVLI